MFCRLLGFSLLCLALTRPVRAESGLNQTYTGMPRGFYIRAGRAAAADGTHYGLAAEMKRHKNKPKGTPRVQSVEAPSENIQIHESFINIRLTISLDVEEAKIRKNMLNFSQFMSRDEDSKKEDETRSVRRPSRKKEGLIIRTQTEMLRSNFSLPRGEENNMEDRRHRLMRASRRKEGHRIQKKTSRPSWSKMEVRRRWLMRALLRIMKKNALVSKTKY